MATSSRCAWGPECPRVANQRRPGRALTRPRPHRLRSYRWPKLGDARASFESVLGRKKDSWEDERKVGRERKEEKQAKKRKEREAEKKAKRANGNARPSPE